MILVLPNPSQVILQAYALNPDGSQKTDVTSATVRVYNIVAGSENDILAVQSMSQVGGTNKWRYVWTPGSLATGEYTAEYILQDASKTTKIGEEITVKDIALQSTLTLVQADVTVIKQVESGRWKMVGNQMIFYSDDDVTPLLTFDLKDDSGLPTMTNVYERVPA